MPADSQPGFDLESELIKVNYHVSGIAIPAANQIKDEFKRLEAENTDKQKQIWKLQDTRDEWIRLLNKKDEQIQEKLRKIAAKDAALRKMTNARDEWIAIEHDTRLRFDTRIQELEAKLAKARSAFILERSGILSMGYFNLDLIGEFWFRCNTKSTIMNDAEKQLMQEHPDIFEKREDKT